MIKFWTKTISLIIFICALTLSCASNIAQAQTLNQTPNWDLSNSELQISSPIANQIEVGQDFYLRYFQSLKSFEATTNINWKIVNPKREIIYQRVIDSNQDKNQVVKITEPGLYLINLKLLIDSQNIEISKELKVIPKDKEYYKGLQFSEISLENSQIELWNSADKDIDASALFLDYNGNNGHQSLSKISTIPSKTYAVFDLNPKLKSGKISLSFAKNLKQNTVENIAQFNQENLLQAPKSTGQSLQFDKDKQIWSWAGSTLGQSNALNQANHGSSTEFSATIDKSTVTPNFQRIQTIRTGGFDFRNLISLIPFWFVFIVFMLSLILEKVAVFNLKIRFTILIYWYLISELEFYFLTKLTLFKTV